MIQRIQSIYLLLIVALMAATVFCPLFDFKDGFTVTAFGVFFDGVNKFPTWGVLTFGLLTGLVAFVNIFMYKNRKRQLLFCNITTVLIILFYITFGVYMNAAIGKLNLEYLSVQYGIILPAIALVFNILAQVRIKADEKLVRSLDRIR
ncbi:DUF4293 domain-containing protein [Dysgonomonas sp. 520]|uniref:DUF4293 domain-containing protein n=1 Tax=Dysgonomonas sp. 520 TaxID=2302931 RepID=UPI0013D16DDE|nr:DUF4293 domain-containing protein [Dysgonomonas sp. 520]NDW10371.1 DUF4293 family protein [Dysgonomonas sp. 520]